MKIQKILAVLLSLAMMLSLAACSSTPAASEAVPHVGPARAAIGTDDVAAIGVGDLSSTAQLSSDAAGKFAEAETPAANGEVSMKFTWWGSDVRHEATEKATKLYCEQNNINIVTEYSAWDGYWEKMAVLAASNSMPDIFQMDAAYINTYIERDIKDLAQVGKLNEFYDFLVYMAARTGQELKYSDIANAIGISAPTAKAWVSILERSGVIFILHPYYSNITKRLVKTPKVYFMDTGLAAYLCRWPNAATLENGAMDGAFLETYVVTEIVKSCFNAGKPADLFYYRDIDRKEIDLLIVEGDTMYPIEIKKGKEPSKPDKNFDVLAQFKMNVQPGIILCMSDELIPYNRQTWCCPISVL